MKTFILLIMIISYLVGAKIDTTLFMGDAIPQHLKALEEDLQSPIQQKLKSKATLALEKSTLKKLQQLYLIKDKIKPFELISLDRGSISQERYLQALFKLSALQQEIKRLKIKEKTIQEKLFDRKSIIEKSIPQESNSSLLHNQLQYAFYKISQEKIEKSLTRYKQLFTQEFDTFQHALARVTFRENIAKKIIKHTDKKIDAIKNRNLLLTIDKDSEAQRDTKAQQEIVTKERDIQKERDIALTSKTKAQILLALKFLKEKNQTTFLEITKEIKRDFDALSKTKKAYYNTVLELILRVGEVQFDDASVLLASGKVGFDYIKNSAIMIANKTLFVYEDKAFSIKTILIFIFIIMIGFIIAKIYKNIIDKFRKKNRIKSLSTARLIANSGYYLILLITFFTALATIGLDIHTIFLVIGAILLWLALGMQGFIANYAMGILIKIDRSIRIGDHVEIDAQMVGIVDDMDFRSITIHTNDGIRYIIPNSRFISKEFINHSLEKHIRRIHIPFSVDKHFTHSQIETVLLESLQQSNIPHLQTSPHHAQVIITDLNKEITRYSLLVWITQQAQQDIPIIKSEFLRLIQKSLAHLPNYAKIRI